MNEPKVMNLSSEARCIVVSLVSLIFKTTCLNANNKTFCKNVDVGHPTPDRSLPNCSCLGQRINES